ncbi:MAG TPA: alpha/beta hydrolase-fold protein [Telluria sp.]|nr:alpha/beta hydrolase-fold protein [Telluria sp.]
MRLLRTIAVFLTFTSGAAMVAAAQPARPVPYALPGTAVHELRAANLGRDYQLFVSLPDSYGTSNRSYPVVFATDANYAFPVIRAIAARAGDGGRHIGEFILVGLSYAKGDTVGYSRRRDYTISPNAAEKAVSDMPGRPARFGEAEGYRLFLDQVAMPFVARHYRADMSRAVFVGHSYGSLLGIHIMFTKPSMFSHYILGSPSLWFDRRVAFQREREYAAAHRDLPARVYFAIGEYETLKPGSRDARYNNEHDMVRDLELFHRTLSGRGYRNLRTEMRVIADEDHLTLAPLLFTRGLKWALPGAR